MNRLISNTFILIVLISINCSCKRKKRSLTYEEFQEKVTELMGTVKNPGDVAASLELSDLDFKPALMNSPANYTKYTDNPLSAAANIGVYIVDVSYQHVYRQYDGAFNSYTSAKELAKTLGIEDAMWDITFKRQAYEGTKDDAILKQLSEVILKSEELLEKNEKQRVYVALLIGNYVEKLHILLNLITKGNRNLPEDIRLLLSREIIIVTGKQLSKIDNLLELIEIYKTKDDINFMEEELSAIKEFKAKFIREVDIARLTPDAIFNNPLIYEIYESVKKMRDYITMENN